ncbi:MAG: lysoplasmalogenase [Bacilli bacterium]|nr:lysoplasmalogenase [Bacilli bacterium]
MIPKSIVMSLILIIAIILAITLKSQRNRILVIFATLFGLIGDVIMALDASWRVMVGGSFFLLEHIVYIAMLVLLIKKEKINLRNNIGFYIGVAFFVISVVTIEALAFTMVEKQNIVLAILVAIYILGLSTHLSLNFAYSYKKKGTYYLFALGMLIFFITDIWVFLSALKINTYASSLIWYFYPIGQLLLVLFNNDLVFEKRKVAKHK